MLHLMCAVWLFAAITSSALAQTVPPGDLSLSQTPDTLAAPDREAQEHIMRQQLAQWDARIDAFTRRAHETSSTEMLDTAARLEEALKAAKQQWQKVAQATEDAWQTSKKRYESAYAELLQRWNEATKEK